MDGITGRKGLGLSCVSRQGTRVLTAMPKPRRFAVGGCGLLLCGILCAQDKPTIQISSASYGLNVDKRAAGNATKCLSSACNGKRSCDFAIRDAAKATADDTPYKYKDFDFSYRCGSQVKKGHIGGNARSKTIMLSCAD
jgi:hypothetical protein